MCPRYSWPYPSDPNAPLGSLANAYLPRNPDAPLGSFENPRPRPRPVAYHISGPNVPLESLDNLHRSGGGPFMEPEASTSSTLQAEPGTPILITQPPIAQTPSAPVPQAPVLHTASSSSYVSPYVETLSEQQMNGTSQYTTVSDTSIIATDPPFGISNNGQSTPCESNRSSHPRPVPSASAHTTNRQVAATPIEPRNALHIAPEWEKCQMCNDVPAVIEHAGLDFCKGCFGEATAAEIALVRNRNQG
ncbi:hypothetical protein MMC06_000145 [Schaereria dolodes]|nr:hypothetical protein [Schaereria dolodes]